MDTFTFVSIFVSIVALSFLIGYFNQLRITRAWQELADRIGLTCEVKYVLGLPRPKVVGSYRGRSFTLDRYSVGSGRSRRNYTRIVVEVNNPAKATLVIYKQTIFSEIGKAMGMQDIQTGDAQIDQNFVIKSESPNFASAVLSTGTLRQKLLESQSLNIQLKGPQLRLLVSGVITDVDRLQSFFEILSEMVIAVERAS